MGNIAYSITVFLGGWLIILMTKISLAKKSRPMITLLAVFFAVLAARGQETQPFSINTSPLPAPTGFVNDYAGVIDAATKERLEAKLKNFKETTNPTVELAVAVVRTTGDRPIFDYSLAVARGWGIGSKEDDSPSALLFVAIEDRKYFTQISRDLEDELPDGVAGSLQREFLVPEFRKGNYGKGISDTIDAYIATIRNKGNAPVRANTNVNTAGRPSGSPAVAGGLSIGSLCCIGIVILVILMIILASRGGRNKDDDDGPSGGSGVGDTILPAILGGLIGSSLSGGSRGWGGSSGGWGGSSGGFGGGGGFGGFGGGGGFSGGGSGGSW